MSQARRRKEGVDNLRAAWGHASPADYPFRVSEGVEKLLDKRTFLVEQEVFPSYFCFVPFPAFGVNNLGRFLY